MSGPVTEHDAPAVVEAPPRPSPSCVEVTPSHVAQVGRLQVRRALPRRARRTVGAWCFLDHMGPVTVTEERGVEIGPHPHIGLQTVTWLVAGEILHRDSLGSEQVIRPGQLNLMTAGGGVAHSEEGTGTYAGDVHGVQLWVAQPEATRHGPPAFEHHPELPRIDLGAGVATVLVGALGATASPARRDTDHVGIDLDLRVGTAVVPADSAFEYALVVLDGAVLVDDRVIEPGNLAYLGLARHELPLTVTAGARALLVGGVPCPESLVMWWNFVGRSRDEITAAYRDWQAGNDRFGAVDSPLPRIPVDPPAWTT